VLISVSYSPQPDISLHH